MISEQEYESLQEMIYIYSISCLVEKIKKGIDTSLEECIDKLEWE